MRKVLVAGGSGQLGRHVVAGLLEEGYAVRVLARRPEKMLRIQANGAASGGIGAEIVAGDLTVPASLRDVCAGVDVVVSCAGASMDLRSRQRDAFEAVDFLGNRNLLEEAQAAGVRKFVYVSLYGAADLAGTAYAGAHERFVATLYASGMPATVVRPTGFHGFFGEIFQMARQGRGVVLGPGTFRTNPIHEADVAACCIEAIDADVRELPCGGPDVLTRREIVELAFDVLGRKPRILSVPPGVMRAAAALARPFNPRIAGLLQFGVEVSLVDVVAPVRGRRTLRACFEALAAAGQPAAA